MLTGSDWFRRVEAAAKSEPPESDVTRTEDSTKSLALDLRVVVLHVTR